MKQKCDILPFLVHPALIPTKVAFSEIAGFFYVILYFIPQKANTINTYHDEKAFNRVNWLKLLEVLKSIGVDWCD